MKRSLLFAAAAALAAACGSARATGATSVLDTEPTRGGATVVHRLYYRVVALDRARALDSTTVLPFDLR